MIRAMAARDLQAKYTGTIGGFFWAFAHPAAIIAIYYVVFAVGFKAKPPGDAPFILWFVCGLVPWFFFSETLLAITSSVTTNAHLIKKTVFPSETLAFVHLLSGLFPHAVFMGILLGLMAFFDVPFLADRLGLLYFFTCTVALLMGLGWLLSAVQVFYRDISHGLQIVLNLMFWGTPIVWPLEILPEEFRGWFVYNPMLYIIEGYRGVLIYPTATWPTLDSTLYFWSVTGALVLGGTYVFGRLKPEFADVM